MVVWTVELDEELFVELESWTLDRQFELDAIQRRLARGGPEGMGVTRHELEGVPPWKDLGGVVSLRVPVDLPSGFRVLTLEVQPGFTIIVVSLE